MSLMTGWKGNPLQAAHIVALSYKSDIVPPKGLCHGGQNSETVEQGPETTARTAERTRSASVAGGLWAVEYGYPEPGIAGHQVSPMMGVLLSSQAPLVKAFCGCRG